MMKIAVVDNYDSFVFNLVRYLREIPNVEVQVMRNRAIDYKVLEECDGILLSPGPGIPEEAGDLMKIIDQFKILKPLFGVCLGHQAIGQYFGLNLEQGKTIIHGKSSPIKLNVTSPLFIDLPPTTEVGRYHSWQLSQANSTTEMMVTAETMEGEIMAIQHTTLPIHGVQFHPESVLTPEGRKMIKNWTNTLR